MLITWEFLDSGIICRHYTEWPRAAPVFTIIYYKNILKAKQNYVTFLTRIKSAIAQK